MSKVANLVPKLRFPAFQDAWEMTPIGEKVDLLSGYPFDGPEISQDSNGVRLLRGINITEGRIRHTPEIDRYYTGETDGLEKFRVRLNDLVIGMDGSKVGKNSSLISGDDADALLIQRVARLRTSSPTLIQFIFQQVNSPTFHAYVDKINTSSGIPHISAKQIKEFTIGFPSLAEQQKIAECLSSVDELMAAQARKVDSLKTHKKGLMQQLFPREGETQPRLRFPEFQDAGEWVSDSLGNVFETSSGGTPSRTEKTYWNGDIPWITTSLVDFSVITSAEEFLTAEGLKNSSAKPFPKGTVLMAMYGQGKTRGQVALLGIRAATNQACAAILPRIGIDPYFVFLNLAGRYEEIREISNSGGQENLSQGLIREIRFAFPPDNDEQRKVTACLSSLDATITAETQKLEALKTHKKGLMQQLFPAPEAVAA